MNYKGICKLCGLNSKFVKSHIIPEWAYKPMYDKEHKVLRVSSSHRSPVGRKYSGEWDRFLCQKCEDTFKDLDDYARAIIYSTPTGKTFGIMVEPATHGMNVLNIDYKRLKLYQLSILWKASACNREFYKNVNLGEHENTIKNMLIEKNPGKSDAFGCIMTVVKHNENGVFDHVIDMPKQCNIDGWDIIRFFYAGTIWLYVISANTDRFPFKKYFVHPNAPLHILLRDLKKTSGLMKNIEWLKNYL